MKKTGVAGVIMETRLIGRKLTTLTMVLVIMGLATIAYGQADVTQQGIAFLQAQRFKEAVRLFNRIVIKDPNNIMAVYYRGMARYYLNDNDAAIADYTFAIKKNPENADFFTSRGVAYFRIGDYGRAKKDLDTALKIKPDDTNALNQKAWMMATCPDPKYRNGKEAVSLATQAINHKPAPNYMDTLAAAYAETGKYKRAISTQRKVITMLTQEERFNRLDLYLARLKSYEANQPWRASNKQVATAQPVKKQPQADTKDKPSASKKPYEKPPVTERDQSKKPAIKTVQPKAELPSKKASPKTTTVPKKAGLYPYTIFISTYQDSAVTKNKVVRLRRNNDPAFMSHAFFKDSGHWYQVYYGWYHDLESAKQAAESLKKRHFRKAIIVKKPFAVQVGVYTSKTNLDRMDKRLSDLNYPPYRVVDSQNPKRIRLLIGAYSTATVPDEMLATLKKAGLDPIIIKR